jgi:hypothetical protein
MARVKIWLAAAVSFLPLHAQKPYEYWPGTAYDARIPTVRQILNYDLGEQITSHAGLLRYLEALATAAPARMKVF